jgi:hypothetical protein
MDDMEEYDQEVDYFEKPGQTVGPSLAKKKKKTKKKRKMRPVEYEDPSLREHLLAGAYGGIAKPKPKRQGVVYTTDLNAGLRDIATPNNMRKELSRRNIHQNASQSGVDSGRKHYK